ncbi:MAG: hypothetical protein K1X57_06380 [Gemmataceae bacterium]|nr:hypothetical protein [Gemmataceae bacterium]
MTSVWVFNGGGNFPAAVFTTRELAEAWIAGHKLTGVLTKYPVDVGVYEWAIECGAFEPKRSDQSEPRFIGRFSSASMEHYHYTAGVDALADAAGDRENT